MIDESMTTIPATCDENPGAGATVVPLAAAERLPLRLLPDKPLFTLRPSNGWVRVNLGELWAYRELLYYLAWRDVMVRYKQTALGVAWAILQPLATMVVFSIFFGGLAHVPSDDIPYSLFALSGLVLWTFFANAITSGGNSLVNNAYLISKVYFPRMLVPAASVLAGFVDFAIALALLAAVMIWYGIAPTWRLMLFPVPVALLGLLAFAVGMWMAAVSVRFRDVRHALPFVVQLWMFASPVIYPISMVPERWRWVLALNPVAGIVEAARATLFGRDLDWGTLGLSAAVTFGALVYSAFDFRRMEKAFADLI